ncbi:homocysteine S-methyltransferase [Bifidobacterium simiarum]|uniref:S-methylmethionine:homocysteine methyltransferase n=1 Tax=Bifidobacterium simiarum TaxID=2045441 RepID=A0A2M9HE41_9BIFI|nr:homocysteine S-methyltransferase [Bifidobacterium simiarum]PJM75080.1 homocysteine S-methyltransferase [Bifidobacterium simiarum]
MNGILGNALATHPTLVADGAMATELEKRGVDTANALWSATALLDRPGAIRDVHRSYFEAGSDIATTDTYQANVPAFERLGLSTKESERLIGIAVTEAIAAREEYRTAHAGEPDSDRPLIVAGSVGPYGAFLADGSEYTGDYALADAEYRDFHRPRMRALADAGVDVFAFETMPNLGEVRALAGLLADEFPDHEAWVSFSLRDAGHLCDGTAIERAVAKLEENPRIAAIGVNCVPPELVSPAIERLRAATTKPIIVYPNNGDVYHPDTKTWTPNPDGADLARLAPEWVAAGASIIGGCCRTTPDNIRALATAVRRGRP